MTKNKFMAAVDLNIIIQHNWYFMSLHILQGLGFNAPNFVLCVAPIKPRSTSEDRRLKGHGGRASKQPAAIMVFLLCWESNGCPDWLSRGLLGRQTPKWARPPQQEQGVENLARHMCAYAFVFLSQDKGSGQKRQKHLNSIKRNNPTLNAPFVILII